MMTDAELVAAYLKERDDAILVLREICREYGDNDWDERVLLADIIKTHLWQYLDDMQADHKMHLDWLRDEMKGE